MNISEMNFDTREMELGRRWLSISDVLGALVGAGIAIAALVVILAG
jgi:hypothetical protein